MPHAIGIASQGKSPAEETQTMNLNPLATVKKPYNKPRLTAHGNIEALTTAVGTGSAFDGFDFGKTH